MTQLDSGCYWARRTPGVDPDIAYVGEEGYQAILSVPDGTFVRLWDSRGPATERRLQELSTRLGETVYIGVHDGAEYFQMEIWSAGLRVRALLYTQDAGWETVQGEARSWETDLLFSMDRLADHQTTHGADDGAAIEESWRRRILRPGDRWPMIGATLLAHEVRERLGLP